FQTTDSQAATLKTFYDIAHAIALTVMWLFGDFLPKKFAFLSLITLWMGFGFASILVTQQQFWLFVLLRSIAAAGTGAFRVLITVLQADHFTGKNLVLAITADVIGESVSGLLSSTVNAFFVSSGSDWRLGILVAPTLSIPLLVLSCLFLRRSERNEMRNVYSAVSNAFGIVKRKSYSLIVLSQSIALFYSLSLGFWMPSLALYAVEVFPASFLGVSYPGIMTLIANFTFFGCMA
ncbi:hypothetical protein PFISCL1PPCAC_22196, partial [Pristionchus fissidentatus]